MKGKTGEINIKSAVKEEMIDITSSVADHIRKSGINDGICIVYTPHTTAAVTINENADPDVPSDIIRGLMSLKLEGVNYDHMEGNSPAHIKSSLIGISETLIIERGEPLLGTWQGIFFCEFDGPRSRKVYVKVSGG